MMCSVPSELSLEFRPTFLLKTIGEFIKKVSVLGNGDDKVSKVDDLVKRLQEEMRKIDAFKRELPLCMLLLNDAIFALKDETVECSAPNVEPVLEQFIPLKRDCDGKTDEVRKEKDDEIKKQKDWRDKKNWMSSVQLWNTEDCTGFDKKHDLKIQMKKNEKANSSAAEALLKSNKGQNGERSFMPFKAYSDFSVTVARKEEDKRDMPVHGLSLLTRGIKTLREESGSMGPKLSCSRGVNVQPNSRACSQQQHASRKQRRCWSPELHRRFVSALQQLGGSQAATPKQIRELMQVDGLTNDEVKSHLQKYRLHSSRVSATTTPSPTNQSLVAFGKSCVPQDVSPKAISSQSGSPQGPFQLALTGGGTSTTGCDDSMNADDDDKSESYSWKSHGNKHFENDV